MRVLVTGAGNPHGEAIVHALLREGHQVRLFGVGPDVAARFAGEGTVEWFPGELTTGGSIEPVLSEREALVHAACLDDGERHVLAKWIERGTLYARYGAEREQVDHFIHVTPREGGRLSASLHKATATAQATRGPVHIAIVHADAPEATASAVLTALQEGGRLGKQPGRESDAVTA